MQPRKNITYLPSYLPTVMKCSRCKDNVIKNGLKYSLSVKQRYYCYSCRHMFSIQIKPPVPRQKRFSIRRETPRQIIHTDDEEDKNRKNKEYSF